MLILPLWEVPALPSHLTSPFRAAATPPPPPFCSLMICECVYLCARLSLFTNCTIRSVSMSKCCCLLNLFDFIDVFNRIYVVFFNPFILYDLIYWYLFEEISLMPSKCCIVGSCVCFCYGTCDCVDQCVVFTCVCVRLCESWFTVSVTVRRDDWMIHGDTNHHEKTNTNFHL